MNFKDQTVNPAAPAAPASGVKPLPTLLSSADAMLWAADNLEKKAMDVELLSKLYPIMQRATVTDAENTAEYKQRLEEVRVLHSGIVDAELQLAAMRAGAKAIREAANEAKLVEARAAARGLRP